MHPDVLPKLQWGHLIPHQGAMSLLDAVVAWDANTLHARTSSHRRGDNPLRDGTVLRAVHLAEYGAQAMAVHGALCAQASGGAAQPGFLVSLRAVRFAIASVEGLAGDLDVHAEKLLDTGSSWQYAFRVEHAGNVIAEGRAAVMVGAQENSI